MKLHKVKDRIEMVLICNKYKEVIFSTNTIKTGHRCCCKHPRSGCKNKGKKRDVIANTIRLCTGPGCRDCRAGMVISFTSL